MENFNQWLLAGIFPALFVVAASYAGCNKLLVVVSFVLSMAFMGNYYPGMRVNALDLSPNYAGTIIAISNGAASLSGVIVPTFIGYMTPDVIFHYVILGEKCVLTRDLCFVYFHFQSTLDQWRLVFWTTFVIGIVRTTIYVIWASADVQPWNEPETTKQPECHKLTDGVEKC